VDFQTMPMAPGGAGLLGHNSDFRSDRLGTLNRLSQATEPLLRLKVPMPGMRAMVANDPDLVQEALVEKAKYFAKSDMLRFSLYPLAGEGVFTSNGELWRRQRKLMAPLFHPKALEQYAPDMVACTRPHDGGLARRRGALAERRDDAHHHGGRRQDALRRRDTSPRPRGSGTRSP
jgi:cytochrome P450